MMIQRLFFPFVFIALMFSAGCASYQSGVSKARSYLVSGDPESAALALQPKAQMEGKDQVVFLLDYALALHEQGDYKASTDAFLKAEDLADLKDYTSITRESAAFLTSERLRAYKSERYENLLINGYLALNFLMMGQYDEALVECRKIDQKLHKMKMEGEKATQSIFARYLSAMIWEAQGKWDSAYIDYKNAYNIDASLKYLRKDLIRSAWRARRMDAFKKWSRKWPDVKVAGLKKAAKTQGELIFVYQQGWVPRKRKRPEDYRFPYLVPVGSRYQRVRVAVDDKYMEPSQTFYDVSKDAVYTINAYYKILVAKKIAGEIAKQLIAKELNKKNDGLGSLVYLAMKIADQADLRQWSTLPESFQVSRIMLPPGKHKVRIDAQGSGLDRTIWEDEVVIRKGKKVFKTIRTF